jgi:hypothetical protein
MQSQSLSVRTAVSAALAVAAICAALSACGGSNQQPPPPPMPDFGLSVSPILASAVIGNISSSVTVTVVPQNEFNGLVNVTLQGLPSGVTATPTSSFALRSGASQGLTFAVSSSAQVGVFQLIVTGTSETRSHSAQLVITVEPVINVTTYQSGSILYLESDSGTDIARLGLQTIWGGSIVEVSLNGTNFVNGHDTGREVQAAQYDGSAQYDNCAGCTGAFGWNPFREATNTTKAAWCWRRA